MIEGVKILKRSVFKDNRGEVKHIMKPTDDNFKIFGEVYCSSINPGTVKGWSLHKKMTINYTVIRGSIKFVLFDNRKNSVTINQKQEIILDSSNYVSVLVPPLIWNAFQCIGLKKAYIINFTDSPYAKTEVIKMDPYEKDIINYNW
jgi:dTDP-4-dehydrorhamnose 3,5-epimerase